MPHLSPELLGFAVLLCLAGSVTGVLAGLFGIGGGAVSVPVLYQTFLFSGVSDSVAMPLAVGTSLAIIVPTSISSARAHWKKGSVDMTTLRNWMAPVVGGVFLGSAIARFAPSALFKIVFICVASFSAARMFGFLKNWRLGERPPAGPVAWAWAFVCGLLSSLMGVGGGVFANLYMSLYGAAIHTGIGTAASIGVFISAAGTIGYIGAGWGKSGLPPGSLGFISLAAFALVAPVAAACAPIGARLAHRLSAEKLKIAFGAFLLAVALQFLINLIVTAG